MSKKFEPYEYLNDNGFFNNDFQYETVIIPVENKNEISYCEKAELLQKRNESIIDKIIYEWSKKNVKSRIIEEKQTAEMFDYNWLDDNE